MTKLSLALSAVVLVASADAALADPDLVPDVSQLDSGIIAVVNNGNSASAATYVAVVCDKLPGSGGCPETAEMAAYEVPQFGTIPQGHAVVAVPALQPGQSFSHNYSFWDDLDWTSGAQYQLTAYVDPGLAVGESDEGNNNASKLFQIHKTAVGGSSGVSGFVAEPSGGDSGTPVVFVPPQPRGQSNAVQLGGQGQPDALVTPGQPDIIVTPLGFMISKLIKWGQSATIDHPSNVKQAQAGPQNNLCLMTQAGHRTHNSGSVGTGNFQNRYYRDGQLVHSQALNLPAKSGVDWQLFDLYLHEGWNTVEVRLDDGNAVAESNEGNNKRFVKVNLQLDCDGDGKIAGSGPILKAPTLPQQPGASAPQRLAPDPTRPKPPTRTLKLAPAN